jgi:hypothetical protein
MAHREKRSRNMEVCVCMGERKAKWENEGMHAQREVE